MGREIRAIGHRARRAFAAFVLVGVAVASICALLATLGRDGGEEDPPLAVAAHLARDNDGAGSRDLLPGIDELVPSVPPSSPTGEPRPIWTDSDLVSVIVVGADCEPVAAARVDVWAIPENRSMILALDGPPLTTLVSDSTGRCGGILPGERFAFAAKDADGRAEGWGSGKRSEALDLGDGRRGFVIAMSRLAHVMGRVLGENGEPAADATVHLHAARERAGIEVSAPTTIDIDREGRFSLDLRPCRVTLSASRGDMTTPGQTLWLVPDARYDLTLRFGSDTWVSGLVLDAHGAPAAGARIKFWDAVFWDDEAQRRAGLAPFDRPQLADAQADDDGRFKLRVDRPVPGMLAGTYGDRRSDVPAQVAAPLTVPAEAFAAHDDFTIQLVESLPIAGHITGPTREPLAGSLLARARPTDGAPRSQWGVLAWTLWFEGDSPIGDDGRFELSRLHPSATYDLLYYPKPLGSRPVLVAQDVAPGTRDLQLAVAVDDPPSGTLGGLVLAEDTRRPIRDFRITVLAHGPNDHGVKRSWGPMGDGLVPGFFRIDGFSRTVDYLLVVSAPGYVTDRHYHAAVEENEDLMIWLVPRSQLDVSVRRRVGAFGDAGDDAPVPWAEVSIEGVSDYPDLESPKDLWSWSGRADARGRVLIPDMDAGRWRVKATRGRQTGEDFVNIEPGKPASSFVILGP